MATFFSLVMQEFGNPFNVLSSMGTYLDTMEDVN